MKYGLRLALALLLIAVSVGAAAYEILRHNPFEQPDTIDQLGGKRGKAGNITTMELRGTVVDGSDSMANIGGEYYSLNHDVAGYRLVRIENGSVTLSRDGIETVLTLNDDE